jgi:WD40 repeat protein
MCCPEYHVLSAETKLTLLFSQAHVFAVTENGTKISKTEKKLPELLSHPVSIAFSPNGKFVAVGCNIKEVSLWDGETFEPKVRLIFGISFITLPFFIHFRIK